jgi:hypothetical protein
MKLPQLSLRELFLLVVIAAMACGWWRERQRTAPLESRVSELTLLAQLEPVTQSHAVSFAVSNPATLTRMIQSAISPEEWSDRGGTAKMAYFPQTRSLGVCGDSRLHVRVAEFLKKLERFDEKAKQYGESWMDYDKIVSAP